MSDSPFYLRQGEPGMSQYFENSWFWPFFKFHDFSRSGKCFLHFPGFPWFSRPLGTLLSVSHGNSGTSASMENTVTSNDTFLFHTSLPTGRAHFTFSSIKSWSIVSAQLSANAPWLQTHRQWYLTGNGGWCSLLRERTRMDGQMDTTKPIMWQSPIGKQAVPHWASMLRWIWSISEYNLKTRDSRKRLHEG